MSTESFVTVSWKDGSASLSWRALDDAAGYRCAIRDEAEGRHWTVYSGAASRCWIPRSTFGNPHRYSLRIEAQFRPSSSRPEWKTLVPFSLLLDARERDLSAGVLRLSVPTASDCSVYSAYRLVVRDDTKETIVVDERSLGPGFALDLADINSRDECRYKFLGFLDGKWSDLSNYEKFPAPRHVEASEGMTVNHQERSEAAREADPALLYLFTVDTEANLRLMRTPSYERAFEEQILCRWDGREVGIAYLMDQLDARGFKGTFFLDILMEFQFGQETVERTVDLIQSRGHDIQLHLHPSPHLWYSKNSAHHEVARSWKKGGETSTDAFARSLDIALELFLKRVRRSPIAFRSGSYLIQDDFFPALAERGIKIDSSVYAHKNFSASPWMKARTLQYHVCEELIETPIAWLLYRGNQSGEHQTAYQYTLKGQTVQSAIEQALLLAVARKQGLSSLVTITHSHSLVKETRHVSESFFEKWNMAFQSVASTELYKRLRMHANSQTIVLEGVDENRIGMLERLLDAIARQKSIETVTMQQLHDGYLDKLDCNDQNYQPVSEFHLAAKKSRETGLQHYSASYLEWLEERHETRPH